MAPTAIAPRRHLRTVRVMHNTPTRRFTDTLQAIASSGARTAPLLATQLLTLTRHYEILGGAARTNGAHLTVAAVSFNQITTTPRIVPLAETASVLLGGHCGDIADLLRLPVAQRGALIPIVRADLASLEAPAGALEGLHVLACEALLHEADDVTVRQAVLAYTGLGAQTPRAARQRATHLPGSLHRVATLIDDLAGRAGLVLRQSDASVHA